VPKSLPEELENKLALINVMEFSPMVLFEHLNASAWRFATFALAIQVCAVIFSLIFTRAYQQPDQAVDIGFVTSRLESAGTSVGYISLVQNARIDRRVCNADAQPRSALIEAELFAPRIPPRGRLISCPQGVSKMSTLALLQSLKESILSQASVKAIYGEPIVAQGKTVIPVAKIMYGYGAGAGTGGVGDSSARGEGGGGGGGVRAVPVGVIEISDQQTRFVPITDRKKLTGAVLVGMGLGMWLGWRRRR